MARITVEKCLKNVPSRFDLILLASKRARQLASTSREPLVETKDAVSYTHLTLPTKSGV